MASRPLPLPIWDRQARKRISEFMEDSQSTYESRPRRSLNQLLESHPLYDWMLAAYQNSHRSARKIEPFIRKHNMRCVKCAGGTWERPTAARRCLCARVRPRPPIPDRAPS